MALAARHKILLSGHDLPNVSPDILFSRSEALRRRAGYRVVPGTVVELQTLLIGSLYLALEKLFSRFVSIWLRKGNRDADVSDSALEMCNSAWSCLSDLSSRHVRTDDQDEMYTRLSTLHCATVALTRYLRTWQAVILATHNLKQSVNRHPAGSNSGQNAVQEQGRDSCSCGADITSAFHSELPPRFPDPRITNPNLPSDTLTWDRTHSLTYNLNLLTWEVCDRLYSETYYVLTRTEVASIRSEQIRDVTLWWIPIHEIGFIVLDGLTLCGGERLIVSLLLSVTMASECC